ncbi:alpha/beta hydrolase [Emcibacter sp. SYSU 3D8]|uniref:alpha/beta fold hydrolase n=1 Tax=Emcibacter sp. SYSU 3D8 TaxID=3133969 RepID=UPI0031FED87A
MIDSKEPEQLVRVQANAGRSSGPDPVRQTIDLPGHGSFSVLRWESDASKPLLVFAHATGFNAGTYRELLGPLAERFRIVALDQRGHGLSDAEAEPDSLRTWDTFRDDLVAFLEHLGEPAFLSGHSMGGRVAMLAAAARPGAVRGLVMIEPVLMHPNVSRLLATARRFGRPPPNPLAQGAARRRAVFGTRQMMFDAYKGRGAFATWPDPVLRDYIEGGTRDMPNGEVALSCAPAWEAATFASAGHVFWRPLCRVRCPVHVLYAEHESTLRGDVPDLIRERQPDWRLDLVPGTTHFLPMERPELVQEAIRQMADG